MGAFTPRIVCPAVNSTGRVQTGAVYLCVPPVIIYPTSPPKSFDPTGFSPSCVISDLQRSTSLAFSYRSTSNRLIKAFNASLISPLDVSPPKEFDTVLSLHLTDYL